MSTKVSRHFDKISSDYDNYKKKNQFYYSHLKTLLFSLIKPKSIVLEIGCGTGDLLASLKPRLGFGTDISSKMIAIAKNKYSKETNLSFSTKPIASFKNKKIDYVFTSDVIEHLPRPLEVLKQINSSMAANTIFINTMANPIWEPILMLAEKLKLKMPEGKHHRYSSATVNRMLKRAGFMIVHHDCYLLFPIKIPLVTTFFNRFLEPYLKPLAFIEYTVCKKAA